jgi:hypothetical protein
MQNGESVWGQPKYQGGGERHRETPHTGRPMCALAGFYGPASGPLLEAAGGTLLVRCARTQVQQLVQMTTYLPLRSLNSLGARAISRSISSGRASVPHVGSCFTFTSAHCCALGCFQQRSNANAKTQWAPHGMRKAREKGADLRAPEAISASARGVYVLATVRCWKCMDPHRHCSNTVASPPLETALGSLQQNADRLPHPDFKRCVRHGFQRLPHLNAHTSRSSPILLPARALCRILSLATAFSVLSPRPRAWIRAINPSLRRLATVSGWLLLGFPFLCLPEPFLPIPAAASRSFRTAAMADKLRDLSQPIDVPLLDATVAAFYGTGSKEEVITFSVACLVAASAPRLRVYLLASLRLPASRVRPTALVLILALVMINQDRIL